MRRTLVLFSTVLGLAAPAAAQLSLSFAIPGLSIGVNVPVYPQLERVPGYPVYYAPGLQTNFFFYDGMYWVYQDDNWYASTWYDGPWGMVEADVVPLYVLRVPVRYYRRPPTYFRGWRPDAPPRWGEHWGNGWQQRHDGWDRWNRNAQVAPAPLPSYQRSYRGDRYPQDRQQQDLRDRNYRHQPRDAVVRQHFEEQRPPRAPRGEVQGPRQRPGPDGQGSGPREERQRPAPVQQVQPRPQPQQPPRQQQSPAPDRQKDGPPPGRPQQQERAPRPDRGPDREKDEESNRGRGR